MTFLCHGPASHIASEGDKGKSKINSAKFKTKKSNSNTLNNESSSAGVAWMQSITRHSVGSQTILPTLTAHMKDSLIRVMKDSGCQPNVITESLADDLELPTVLSNLNITFHGFNDRKTYKTREVSLSLKLKNSIHNLRAIVVPQINTEFKIPKLPEILKTFESRNYALADEKLTLSGDKVDNIQFILGSSDAHVLREVQREFGSPVPSVFSETEQGVLLYGDSERLHGNLDYLEPIRLITSTCVNESTSDSVSCNNLVVYEDSQLDKVLEQATSELLDSTCERIIDRDPNTYDDSETKIDEELIQSTLAYTSRAADGRLIMPLSWRSRISSRLSNNKELSLKVLKRNEQKLTKKK